MIETIELLFPGFKDIKCHNCTCANKATTIIKKRIGRVNYMFVVCDNHTDELDNFIKRVKEIKEHHGIDSNREEKDE